MDPSCPSPPCTISLHHPDGSTLYSGWSGKSYRTHPVKNLGRGIRKDRVATPPVRTAVSDREGHGHKAVVYKSHFPPLRHSVVTETPADTLANKPCLTKDQTLCSLCPHDMVAARI